MSFTLASNKLYLIPFRFSTIKTRWDRIAIEVTTLEAAKIGKLGVYLSAPTGLPSRRLFQSSEISLASVEVVAVTIQLMLGGSDYWLAIAGNSTTAKIESRSVGGSIGRADADADPATFLTYSFSYSSGANLPLAPTSPTYVTDTDIPLISLRAV